ncbi:hypothetical protein CPB85DRAFT_1447057 [Mucidula mucida]|nr:hypothetical protein CPB85DRAFT_1447057 [Mucidula mucida]
MVTPSTSQDTPSLPTMVPRPKGATPKGTLSADSKREKTPNSRAPSVASVSEIATTNPQTEYWLGSRGVRFKSSRKNLSLSRLSNTGPSPLSGKFKKPESRVNGASNDRCTYSRTSSSGQYGYIDGVLRDRTACEAFVEKSISKHGSGGTQE